MVRKTHILFIEVLTLLWHLELFQCIVLEGEPKLIYIFKLQVQKESATGESELANILGNLEENLKNTLNVLVTFQSKNSEHVFNTGYFSYIIHYS